MGTCLALCESRYKHSYKNIKKEWQPIPVLLPGEFHGQRSRVGYSPGDGEELDRTVQLTFKKEW